MCHNVAAGIFNDDTLFKVTLGRCTALVGSGPIDIDLLTGGDGVTHPWAHLDIRYYQIHRCGLLS